MPQSAKVPSGDPRSLPLPLSALAQEQHGLLLLHQCYAAGLAADEVRRRLRRREWRAVRSGVLATGPVPTTRLAVLAERAMAVLLLLPAGAMICGRTAAVLWRLSEPPPEGAPIHVLLPPGAKGSRLRGVQMHVGHADSGVVLGGVRCTSLARTVLDGCAELPLGPAVALLDQAERMEPGALEDCRRAAATRSGRGCRTIRLAVRLATGLPESVLESIAWVLWHTGGLPSPVLQAVVRRAGRFIARVDFLWPEAMLIVEVDGLGKYTQPGELQREKARQNLLVAEGYRVLRFTWADVVHRPETVLRQVRDALMINSHISPSKGAPRMAKSAS